MSDIYRLPLDGVLERCDRELFFCVSTSFLLLIIFYYSTKLFAWQQSYSSSRSTKNEMKTTVLRMLQSVDFEVFGRVQGVFFRKFTREKGKQLGLKGWCMNTSSGTVLGTMQGPEEKIIEMKDWLKHTGSPHSKIEKAEFKNERHLSKEEFSDFFIKP
ncbi:acylphosphatase-1 isoform X2 [Parasteatoda tepidariorum]|uniref:acylphosphatase-1 isoform X2 n=1 Tax=Parasteatoda tepidariorum TaxID=114398 RepID=UPI0039BC83FB